MKSAMLGTVCKNIASNLSRRVTLTHIHADSRLAAVPPSRAPRQPALRREYVYISA